MREHLSDVKVCFMVTPLTIADLKKMAQRRVPKMFVEYANYGAWTKST